MIFALLLCGQILADTESVREGEDLPVEVAWADVPRQTTYVAVRMLAMDPTGEIYYAHWFQSVSAGRRDITSGEAEVVVPMYGRFWPPDALALVTIELIAAKRTKRRRIVTDEITVLDTITFFTE